MTATQKYHLLLAKQNEIGWPHLFIRDLTDYDREIINKFNPEFFIWLVYDDGTWLILPDSPWCLMALCWVIEKQTGTRAFVFQKNQLQEHPISVSLLNLVLKHSQSQAIKKFASLRSCGDNRFWNASVAGNYALAAEKETGLPGLAEVH